MKKLIIVLSIIAALLVGFLAGFNTVLKAPQWIRIYNDHYDIITSVYGHEFISKGE